MANQHLSNNLGGAAPTGASVALPSLASLGTSSSLSTSLSSTALPSLPPPTVGTALGIGAAAVASTLLTPGHGTTLTGAATAGAFAASLKNLVLPSGTTKQQQQESMTMGALGLVAVAAVTAVANASKDSTQTEAARARDEAKKAQEEAAAAKRAAEQQAFLWGKTQSRERLSPMELQMALELQNAYAAQRDRNKT